MLIEPVHRDAMPDELRKVYDMAAERVGDTRFIEGGAHAPEVLQWFFDSFYGQIFYSGRVDVRVKEIVRLRLAKSHGCAFCNRWDTVDALDAGVEQHVIDAITAYPDEVDAAAFHPRELAAMRYADQMVLQNMHGHLDPELYAELRRHFDDAQIIELGFAMAVLTGMAKLLFIADLVPTEDNCPVRPATG